MLTLYFIAGWAVLGAIVWLIAERREKYRAEGKIRSLETKNRLIEGQRVQLNEQIGKLQQEVAFFQQSLEEEKKSKLVLETAYRETSSKKLFLTGGLSLAGGTLLGGFFFGLIIYAALTVHYQKELVDLQVTAKTSQQKVEFLEQRLGLVEKQAEDLRLRLDAEKEEKIVALTKLEIVLENLVSERWGNKVFSLFPKRNKKPEETAQPLLTKTVAPAMS